MFTIDECSSVYKEIIKLCTKGMISFMFIMLVEYIQPLQRASMKDPFLWWKVEQNAFEEV